MAKILLPPEPVYSMVKVLVPGLVVNEILLPAWNVKELEMVSSEASILSLLRDFLYTPFIFIGHQISYRYAKINLVARLLDNAIELPLKTTLRLVRQWTNFLSNKKDEIL